MSKVGARPTIANVTMTSAATEYSYALPAGTTRFTIKLRALNALLQLAFASGTSGTTYITIPYGDQLPITDVKGAGITLYFQSPTASQTAEISSWKS